MQLNAFQPGFVLNFPNFSASSGVNRSIQAGHARGRFAGCDGSHNTAPGESLPVGMPPQAHSRAVGFVAALTCMLFVPMPARGEDPYEHYVRTSEDFRRVRQD